MNSKNRYLIALTAVSTFILLTGSFVVMAQDGPTVLSDDQKIGDLEQEVIELQNRIQALKTGSTQQPVNDNVAAPQPAYDSNNRPNSNAPAPNSLYSRNPMARPIDPTAGVVPQIGYDQGPPAYVVRQQVDHYVPVQVPVYVEPPPCVHYQPVCNQFVPPSLGLEFFFGGGGGHGHKHGKHKH